MLLASVGTSSVMLRLVQPKLPVSAPSASRFIKLSKRSWRRLRLVSRHSTLGSSRSPSTQPDRAGIDVLAAQFGRESDMAAVIWRGVDRAHWRREVLLDDVGAFAPE